MVVLTKTSRIVLMGLVAVGAASLISGAAHADTVAPSSDNNPPVSNQTITDPASNSSATGAGPLVTTDQQNINDTNVLAEAGPTISTTDGGASASNALDSLSSPQANAQPLNDSGVATGDNQTIAVEPVAPSVPPAIGGSGPTHPTSYHRIKLVSDSNVAAATRANPPSTQSSPAKTPAKPTVPNLPQGIIMLSEANVMAAGQVHQFVGGFLGGSGASSIFLMILAGVLVAAGLVLGSEFLQSLRKAGSSRAPRGATSSLIHFAFPTSELATNRWFELGSLFNLTGLVATARVS